jgi:hypothetical protein
VQAFSLAIKFFRFSSSSIWKRGVRLLLHIPFTSVDFSLISQMQLPPILMCKTLMGFKNWTIYNIKLSIYHHIVNIQPFSYDIWEEIIISSNLQGRSLFMHYCIIRIWGNGWYNNKLVRSCAKLVCWNWFTFIKVTFLTCDVLCSGIEI